MLEEHSNSLELFNASFMSCWNNLYDDDKSMMIKHLESAFDSPSIPTQVLQVLLNLAEFMEHDEHKLFDAKTLWKLAYKCKAYAKALHYKEVEFYTSAPNSEIIENLISLNNLLNQHEAACGIRMFASGKGWGDLQWLQEFHRWQDAEVLHDIISERLLADRQPSNKKGLTLIRMKCLKALSDWNKLSSLAENKWTQVGLDGAFKKEIAHYAAAAAWNLGKWEDLEKYSAEMDATSFEQTFYTAILSIRENQLQPTKKTMKTAWEIVDAKLPGLLRESYLRAYPVVIEAQQLCDLEEFIHYKETAETAERRDAILRLWNTRLKGSQPSIDIWEKFLSFRPLLVCPEDDLDTWVEFAELCMKNGQMRLAGDTLETLLLRSAPHTRPSNFSELAGSPELRPASVYFVYLKYLYKQGPRAKPLELLGSFVREQQTLGAASHCLCKYNLQIAKWQKHSLQESYSHETVSEVLKHIKAATNYDPESHRAWHKWGLMNFEALSHHERTQKQEDPPDIYINSALEGFIHSIALEVSLKSSHKLQNILRLITLWFKYGDRPDFAGTLKSSFSTLDVEVWLKVIPQIIARSSTKNLALREQIIDLLKKIAKKHPHALVYPLTMATRTDSQEKLELASIVLEEMKHLHLGIVQDTFLVTNELIRCSVLWRELWQEAVLEASQMYHGAQNIAGMMDILLPLHAQLSKGPATTNETGFYHAFAADLEEAERWLSLYGRSKKDICVHQA